ncbi:MAG: TraR/DksA family transcriptional regulator [Elusimicrobia bacterium]|nr:MAG: TraR/DksA family transcriptional regulator [Elusimicrobiota bacterium]
MSLTDDELKQLREKFEEEIAELEERLPSMKEHSKPVEPDNAIGRISRIEAIQEKEMSERGLREGVERLRVLKDQLEKMGTDRFGRCIVCRQPIAFGRLLFIPETERCVGCA